MKNLCNGLLASVVLGTLVLLFPAGDSAWARENTVYSFCGQMNCTDGERPDAGLVDVNGTLYGTTELGGSGGGGTLFSLDPSTGAETVIYSFCSKKNCTDGESPRSGLIDVNGTLYGTTDAGGTQGFGTAFAVDPVTGAETVLYSFCSQKNCTDGASPLASLIDVNGYLYGTSSQGGVNGYGAVFSLNTSTGAETVIHSFYGGDGQRPVAELIDVKGTLYGTTSEGGGGNGGTVFSIDSGTGKEKVLYSFCSKYVCADGRDPSAGLIYSKGTLYGTTKGGGSTIKPCVNGNAGCGTVFSIDPKTGAEAVLDVFCLARRCRDGAEPESGLFKLGDELYGTTYSGGRERVTGTVFSFDLSAGTETVLYSFCHLGDCTDGENPRSSLIDVSGKLYGTTYNGGTHGSGAVFWVDAP